MITNERIREQIALKIGIIINNYDVAMQRVKIKVIKENFYNKFSEFNH